MPWDTDEMSDLARKREEEARDLRERLDRALERAAHVKEYAFYKVNEDQDSNHGVHLVKNCLGEWLMFVGGHSVMNYKQDLDQGIWNARKMLDLPPEKE